MDAKFKNQRLLASRDQATSYSNRIFELQSCLNSLSKVESKDSGLKLLDTIVNYIDAILNESTTKSIREQIKFCGHLDIIKNCVMPYKEKNFVKNFIQRIFDILLEEDGNIWYVKRELVKIFLICIRRAPKEVRLKAIDTLPDFYLYKLMDSISSNGDYDFQVVMVELVFCVYGKNAILSKWKDLIPESQELSETFSSISSNTFDEDVRKFLNALNEKSSKIFSVFCHDVFLGNIHCGETFENCNGLWVDFNLSGGAVSWYATTEYFLEDKASPSDPPWTMASFFVQDVDFVQVFRPANTRKTVIHVKLKTPCLSSYGKCGSKVAEAGDVKFFLAKDSVKTAALITRILPGMFRQKFHHNGPKLAQATKKVYKPLKLSVARQSSSNTSRTKSDVSSFRARVAPISAGLHLSSVTSPSSNDASEVISISDSSVQSSIDLLAVGCDRKATEHETAQDDGPVAMVQIISRRCTKISLPTKIPSEDSDVFETALGPPNTETEFYETANFSLCVNLGQQVGSDLEDEQAAFRRNEIQLEDILQDPGNNETVVTLPSSSPTKEESASDLQREVAFDAGVFDESTNKDHKGSKITPSNDLILRENVQIRDKTKKMAAEQSQENLPDVKDNLITIQLPKLAVPTSRRAGKRRNKKKTNKPKAVQEEKQSSEQTLKNEGRELVVVLSSILKETAQSEDSLVKLITISEDNSAKPSNQQSLPAAVEKPGVPQEEITVMTEENDGGVEKQKNLGKIRNNQSIVEEIILISDDSPPGGSNKDTVLAVNKSALLETEMTTITEGKLQYSHKIHKKQSDFEEITSNFPQGSNKGEGPVANKSKVLETESTSEKHKQSCKIRKDRSSFDEVTSICEDNPPRESDKDQEPAANKPTSLKTETTATIRQKQKQLRKTRTNQSSIDEIKPICAENPPIPNEDSVLAANKSRVPETEMTAVTEGKQKYSHKIHKDQSDSEEITSVCEDNPPQGLNKDNGPAANEVLGIETTAIIQEKQKQLRKIHRNQSNFEEIKSICEGNSHGGPNKDDEPAANQSKVLETETTAIPGEKQKQSHKLHKDHSDFDEVTSICEDKLPRESDKEDKEPAVKKSTLLETKMTAITEGKQKQLREIHKDQSDFVEITSICEDNPQEVPLLKTKWTRRNRTKENKTDQEAVPADKGRKGAENEKYNRNCVVLLRKYKMPEELGDNSYLRQWRATMNEEDLVEQISSDALSKAAEKNTKVITYERDGFDNELLEASVAEILFDQLRKEEDMKTEAAIVGSDERGYSQQTVVHTCVMVHQCYSQNQNAVTEILTETEENKGKELDVEVPNQAKYTQSFNKSDKKLEEITEDVQQVDESDNPVMSTTLGSRKRRKLYDPGDLTYLDNIAILEEDAKPEEPRRMSTLLEAVAPIITKKSKKSHSKKSNNKTENKPKKLKKLKILHPNTALTSFFHETLQSYRMGTSTSFQQKKNSGLGQDVVKKPSRQQTLSKVTKRAARKTRAAFSRDRVARENVSSDGSEASTKLPKRTEAAQEPDFVASDEQAVPEMQGAKKINIISDIQIMPKRTRSGAELRLPIKKRRMDEENGDVTNIKNEEISQWIETGSPNYSRTIIERRGVLKSCNLLLKSLVNPPDDSKEYWDVLAASQILKTYN